MSRQARGLATRAQLIAGAAEAFDRNGYVGTSLEAIVDSLGLSKGALYFHFGSKEELARAIIAEQHAISIAAVEAIRGEHAPAVEQIVMLCHEMARQIVHEPVVRAGIRITVELSDKGYGPADPYIDWINTCDYLARRAIDQGDISHETDPATFARFVIGAFTGVQTLSLIHTGGADLEERVDDMWMLLLPGIMPRYRQKDLNRTRRARSAGPPEKFGPVFSV
ncbi:ScbR family autoregulator-binding transcription factor [Rhodococcus sp. JVH1]|uniref:ScbR family autoregulator-binding transcription factor n=1 Tax=Rhodococcus sp. JVH1 TaxID=745408 RepID=UPI000271EF2B|nr:ScbR family autoregulator-binding transcription factor [Rhodococcus sp. JVH1]EJI98643.1 transcriptional regulator, TetR family [Rhodococcus sp. JVH1]